MVDARLTTPLNVLNAYLSASRGGVGSSTLVFAPREHAVPDHAGIDTLHIVPVCVLDIWACSARQR